MTDKSQVVDGLSLEQWDAMFRAEMPEYAATTFAFSREHKDLVRIAFGNAGPRVNVDGKRTKLFTHAVMLPPSVAVELAQLLLKFYAEPLDSASKSSGEL